MPDLPDSTLAVLQTELAALRLANQALETQLRLGAERMETMLSALESQRDALHTAHSEQRNLTNFNERVMDAAGSLLIVLAPDGLVRVSNRRCGEALGNGCPLPGSIVDELLPPDERQALAVSVPAVPWPVMSPLFEHIRHAASYRAEHQLRSRDGSYRRYLFEAAVLHSPQGKEEGAVVSATDITLIRQHEARLRRSEFLLKEAQQHAHMGSWELDLRRRKLSWSEEAHRIFEIDPASAGDSYGRFFAVVHPDDRPVVERSFASSLRRHAPLDLVHRLSFADGRIKWVHQRGTHGYAENGRPVRSVGTVQDITERHLADQQLRIAATAFDAQEGMFITDARGVILRVNKAFTRITGYTPEDIAGKSPDLLSSGRHDPGFYAEMWRSIHSTGTWAGEIWNRRKSGEIFPEWLTITAVCEANGEISHYVATLTDITLRKSVEDEVRYLAFYDPLTHLPNRRLLHDRLQQALASSSRSGRYGAILFIDLDNFKALNDTQGHDMGDLLLQKVAERLTSCVREGDTVARLGGDEFVIMLEALSPLAQEAANQTEAVGEKILIALNQAYKLKGAPYHNTPSVGATLFCGHDPSMEDLLKRADLAMYQAKAAGRNTLRFFDPEMQAVVTARMRLEAELRQALEARQFFLHFQVQIGGDGQPTGAEVLVRWQHPQRGLVSPAEFIPIAEESGMIVALGQWILESACSQLARWAKRSETAQLTLSVNVSVRQFRDPDFVEQVLVALRRSGAPPQQLKLELTESLLADDIDDIIEKMTRLNDAGVSFALDDFGTGYSSLASLKRLPFDQLKIDQSFVRDLVSDGNDAAIAGMIVALAESIGVTVIAEGVETEAQRDRLAGLGCHASQGYLFGRPVSLEAFERLVKKRGV